jgi:hypothetical protein
MIRVWPSGCGWTSGWARRATSIPSSAQRWRGWPRPQEVYLESVAGQQTLPRVEAIELSPIQLTP